MISNLFLKKKYHEKVVYYLIVFLPIALVTGPFLSDLSVSLISIIFLYMSFKDKLYKYYQNIFSKIFGIFFVLLILVSIFSIDPTISFKKTIFYFRFWIFSLAVWYILENKNDLIKNLIISFSFIFIILIIDGYYQFFFKENILGWPMQGSRLSSLFKDELILGSYLSRLLPIYFAMLIYVNFNHNKYKFILFFLIFVCIECLTFLSGERVAFFYINLSSIFLIIAMQNYKLFRTLSIITSVVLIFILINLYPKATDRMIGQTVSQLGLIDYVNRNNNKSYNKVKQYRNKTVNVSTNKYIFSIEHQNHYISSLRMFNDNKITGVGPRMFRHLCGQEKYNLWEGCSTHPHNTYIQLLAEGGIVLFIFALFVFISISYFIIKHLFFKFIYKKIIFNDYQLSLISCVIITLWPIIPTGGFFNNWLNIIYFFPIGFVLNSLYTKKKLEK